MAVTRLGGDERVSPGPPHCPFSCPKAFRQLSHRFHGKGSGKMKTERRMKKLDEEAVRGFWGGPGRLLGSPRLYFGCSAQFGGPPGCIVCSQSNFGVLPGPIVGPQPNFGVPLALW